MTAEQLEVDAVLIKLENCIYNNLVSSDKEFIEALKYSIYRIRKIMKMEKK